ncbi:hypothetical protein V8G54_021072 [Vigna mungo]|uniref:Uncharacterized protein n=1 Tax=Vigna mungo TaxID=3915 RepID=A0AAQ3RXC6_VIGMU
MEDNLVPRSARIFLASLVRVLFGPSAFTICLTAAIKFSSLSSSPITDSDSSTAIEKPHFNKQQSPKPLPTFLNPKIKLNTSSSTILQFTHFNNLAPTKFNTKTSGG